MLRFLLLSAIAVSGQEALRLQLAAPAAPLLQGEGIRLPLHVQVLRPMSMETIELNQKQTRIHLQPLSKGPERILTGADHIRLFPAKAMSGLGQTVPVKVGDSWNTAIDLFAYTRALAPGRYRCSVDYEQSRSNPVEFEVRPAKVQFSNLRAFGTTEQRGIVGLGETWLYVRQDAHDATVTLSAVRIPAATAVVERPRLAQFLGIPGMRAESIAVWTEPEKLCWLAVTDAGPGQLRRCMAIPEKAKLAEPALQTADGALLAYVHTPAEVLRLPELARTKSAQQSLYVVWKQPAEPTLLRVVAGAGKFALFQDAQHLGEWPGEWLAWTGEPDGVVGITYKANGQTRRLEWRTGKVSPR